MACTKPYHFFLQILCKCDREVKFDLAVERREFSLAKQHLIAIRTFDSAEASYR